MWTGPQQPPYLFPQTQGPALAESGQWTIVPATNPLDASPTAAIKQLIFTGIFTPTGKVANVWQI